MRKNTYKTFKELIDNLSGFLGDLPQHIAHSDNKKVAEYKKQRNCLFAEDHLYKSPFSRRTIFFGRLAMKFSEATNLKFFDLNVSKAEIFEDRCSIPFNIGFIAKGDNGLLRFHGDLFIEINDDFLITSYHEVLDISIGLSQIGYLSIPEYLMPTVDTLRGSQRYNHPLADLFVIQLGAANARGYKALSELGQCWIDLYVKRTALSGVEPKARSYEREFVGELKLAANQPYFWIRDDLNDHDMLESIGNAKLSAAAGLSSDIDQLNVYLDPSKYKGLRDSKTLDQMSYVPRLELYRGENN